MADTEDQRSANGVGEWARGRRWMRAAYGIWIALAATFTLNALLHPRPKLSYLVFANSSRQWWTDTSIYSSFEGLDLYRYSPTFAVLLTPLALFPDRVGVVLWNLISLFVLFGALRVLVRDLLPGRWPAWREGLFLFLTVFGTIRGVWSGQSNAIVTAGAILAVAAVLRRSWWVAAFLLAGAAFIKIWPIALFLLLAVFYRRELIARFVAASAVLAAIPFLTRPPGIVIAEYASWYETTLRTVDIRWRGQKDAWTIFEQFGAVNEHLYMILQLATAAAVLGWCLYQSRRGLPERHLLMLILSIWVGWQLLFGPGTERLTYGLVAPFATWAMMRSFAEGRLRALGTAAWLFTGLLATGGFERLVQPVFPPAPAFAPFGVVLYILWLLLRESGEHGEVDLASPAR